MTETTSIPMSRPPLSQPSRLLNFVVLFVAAGFARIGSRMTDVNLPGLQAAQVVGDVDGMCPQRLEGHYIEGAFVG